MMVKRLVTRCLVLRTLSSLSMNYHISSLHSFLHLCHCPRNGETEFQRCSEGARMSPLGYPWRRRMLYHIALSGVVFPSPSYEPAPSLSSSLLLQKCLETSVPEWTPKAFVRTDIWTEMEQGGFSILPTNLSAMCLQPQACCEVV